MTRARLRPWLAGKKNWTQILIPLTLLAALFTVGKLIDLDQYLLLVQQEVRQLGPWGPVVYIVIYVVATLLLPGTPFTILAAFLFGTAWGYFTMVVATTLAAVSGFFTARYLARDVVEQRFAGTAPFIKVKKMVEDNSWFSIPFIRLMPIFPFAINNYVLGLSRVPFWTYLITSEIVFLPMNAVFVFGAQAIYRALVKGEASWGLLIATTGATLAVLGVGILGKRFLPANGREDRSAAD